MLSSQTVNDHYKQISEQYDTFPLVSGIQSHINRLETIEELLQLDPNTDLVVDLGAGTSEMGKLWKTKYPHARPFLCVDPSPMLPLNEPLIEPIQASSADFAVRNDIHFDAMILVQSVHNIAAACPDLQELFTKFRTQLRARGRLCVAIRPLDSSNLPLFRAAHETFAKDSLPVELIQKTLIEAGFRRVEIKSRAMPHDLPKSLWYKAIRGRFFSNLSAHSDEEIEAGIHELEQGINKGRDNVVFEDIFHYVCAWK
ncbi:hypothetical protein TCAL_17409 [Tigriopus californicus]|uniref:Methyltransferase type 11 domain-containing protein n=1 Tax=Tigriopus californicus TaxID=6832 RepID=A0A553NDR7_TIGCA|nr:uncharacterized protein LOC131888732 [Tigriopus californicus]XP_059093643.1 uncharacterized protein LOC131888733 [Tigriopus californicus]TRY63554.1 hypothetical protein TCAL_09033 [Tigriopus californicus]TRY63555.1 hypothetical protein TCAL_17409 [Tigriopus californicus]|eukprot:TCALIF_04889-PA protein Name:"Protein of unknown function" AED:0.00 eAED:0.00 QI:82/1/1/1/1/1/3/76/255